MKKLVLIPMLVLFLITFVNAEVIETPVLVWSQTYGGNEDEEVFSIVSTDDEGFALTGGTNSFGEGNYDFYLVKTDGDGNEIWSHTYGGRSTDHADSIVQTEDEGYAICGTTSSFGNGIFDFYLVKTDENGEEEWTHSGYGGNGYSHCQSLIQTPDEGYSMAGKVDGNRYDFHLIQTDENGNEIWSESYHREWSESVTDHIRTENGDFIMVGMANNRDDVWDIYVVRTDENGVELWSESYGGGSSDISLKIIEIDDGEFAIVGSTESFGEGGEDFYLIKIGGDGELLWSQTYGGEEDDKAYSLVQVEDGGFILVGYTESFGEGGTDCYVVRTDNEGELLWSQTYGEEGSNMCADITRTSDNGYALGGSTQNIDEDDYDFWLIKMEIEIEEAPMTDLEQRVGILEILVEGLADGLQHLEDMFNTIENQVQELMDSTDYLEEENEKLNSYLSYTPQEFKEEMLCGYMRENNVNEYTDLGFQCEILQDGHCMCVHLPGQQPENPQFPAID